MSALMRSGSRGLPVSRDRRAPQRCCPRTPRSSPTGAIRSRCANRSTAATGSSSASPRRACPNGSRGMRRTARGSATTRGSTPAPGWQRHRPRWPRSARLWSPSTPTRSTRSGPTAPPRPTRRSRFTTTSSPAAPPPKSAPRSPTGSPRKRPMRWCSPRSIRSPGCSTCAAAMSRARRSRWPIRSSMPTAPRICSSRRKR